MWFVQMLVFVLWQLAFSLWMPSRLQWGSCFATKLPSLETDKPGPELSWVPTSHPRSWPWGPNEILESGWGHKSVRAGCEENSPGLLSWGYCFWRCCNLAGLKKYLLVWIYLTQTLKIYIFFKKWFQHFLIFTESFKSQRWLRVPSERSCHDVNKHNKNKAVTPRTYWGLKHRGGKNVTQDLITQASIPALFC
jgi:hypothetical protein